MKFSQQAFAQRLRDARKEKGLSQEQAAEIVGLTKASISQYETSRAFPTYATLAALALTYGASVDRLFFGDERHNANDQHQLVARIAKLPPQLQHFVALAVQIAEEASGRLPEAILAEPTRNNWMTYAGELYRKPKHTQ